jgi:ferrochelatase
LETLEEINIRARAQWLELGGRSFSFIPCLNTHPAWVEVLVKMIKREAFED